MADPYRRYASPRPSSDRGSIPKPSFPGYLTSDASTMSAYNPYSSIDLRGTSEFLVKDIHPHSRHESYGINEIALTRSEPGVNGLAAGACIEGYPSTYDDSVLQQSHRRDIAPGISPGIPDATYEKPSSVRRTDAPAPAAESNILFVDQLPTDCTRREVGHLFRPFIGFRELRLVHKEPRRRGDQALVLCFVEFSDAKCAHTAMEALQGYKFDDKKPESPLLRIQFAHFPFRLPSDRDKQEYDAAGSRP